MDSKILCVCGHPQDIHDFDEDWSGCCGRKTDGSPCWCKTFEPGPPEPQIVTEPPRKRPLFSQHLTPEEIAIHVKLHPREGYSGNTHEDTEDDF